MVLRKKALVASVATATATLAILTGCGADGASDASSPSVSVNSHTGTGIPITMVQETIPTVMVSVGGGQPVPVQLDSGSAGLRIYQDAVGADVVADPARSDEEITFVDGSVYINQIAKAAVTVGDVAVSGQIDVAVVTDIQCEDDALSCTPGIEAAVADGVYGILGTDMVEGESALASPLLYLPEYQSYTIAYADDGTGLIKPGVPGNPNATWPLISAESGVSGVKGWGQDFTACWKVGKSAQTCLPTTFDSGATTVVVPENLTEGAAAGTDLSATDGLIQLFATNSQSPVWSLSPGNRADNSVMVSSTDQNASMLAGTPLFYSFDIGFDQANGIIGLYPRSLVQ